MFRSIIAASLTLAFALPASAHFVFLVPDGAGKGKAVFSDSLKPDEQVPVDKIATTKLVALVDGKATDLTWAHDKATNCYTFEVPAGAKIVTGSTDYGVFQRGEGKPFFLRYHPKSIVGEIPSPAQATVGERVPVEIVPIVESGKLRFKAISNGKPAAKVDVTVMVPGEEKKKVAATDENGLTESFDKPGQYGAYFNVAEPKAGEQGGKKYEELRNYATLVVTFGK